MIREIRIRGFKRYADARFRLPGQVVLAGPNNTGKTTVLQAVASWAFAFRRWRQVVESVERGPDGYALVPISRLAFAVAPLRGFDQLWKDRVYRGVTEITLRRDDWTVAMEFHADSSEQVYVRPAADAAPALLDDLDLPVIFARPVSGLVLAEPEYRRAKVDQLLAHGRAGEAFRNSLVEASRSPAAWEALGESVRRLFGYTLLPPDTDGPDVLVDYRESDTGPALDIAGAGSGFHQVVMLLALLHSRPGSVLLLDEPDAHLHFILQDGIWRELRRVAAAQRSQLICATHSEVLISAAEPRELLLTLDPPRPVADDVEKSRLLSSLRALSGADLVQAPVVRGVLYVEDYTDLDLLSAWARRLGHRACGLLATEILWKPVVFESERGRPGIRSRDHYEALRSVRPDIAGLELRDGDARDSAGGTGVSGAGLQRLRWRRYEIESYLLHPGALARFVENELGGGAPGLAALREWWRRQLPPALIEDPFGDHPLLRQVKARTELLPPMLAAAGLPDFPYTRYHEIAAAMEPAEIHPEVVEKLDAICRAFGVDA